MRRPARPGASGGARTPVRPPGHTRPGPDRTSIAASPRDADPGRPVRGGGSGTLDSTDPAKLENALLQGGTGAAADPHHGTARSGPSQPGAA
ncbi:conserved hypothetical protein [Streptomyces albidoflavus]|nr:conserved hypothetical protein [Streptomyces albidoflavus]